MGFNSGFKGLMFPTLPTDDLFQHTLTYINQPKVLVTSEGWH